MPHLICFGLGYSARAAARRLAAQGWRITGTARSVEGCAAILDAGYEAVIFDGAAPSPDVRAVLASATHALVSVPPGASGDPVLGCHGQDLAAAPRLEAVVYLSTIGVYGDAGGDWVDETSPCRPVSTRSRARLTADRAWLALGAATDRRIVILRLAGIYGPGRSAIDTLRAGTARRIVKPGQVFNRIHVEDIAAATVAALMQRDARGIFNVTDDEPAPPQDVVAHAAASMGVALPPEIPFETAELSPMAASFYGENKRVRNERLKRELGVVLSFPTYRQGLAQILSES
jgi:nucleoside-diphosphate-sugar epimerase